jgi:PAS domain S-box-containing protein
MAERTSIQQRLRSAVLIPTSIVVALGCAVFVVLQWRVSREDNERRLHLLAEIVAENSASALAFANPDDAARVLRVLHTEPAIKDAVLFDRAGLPFARYRAPDAVLPPPAAPLAVGLHSQHGRLVIVHPVREGQRDYGVLFLRWDLRPWYIEMRVYSLAGIGVLAAALAAAVLVTHMLRRKIARPILALAGTAARIAQQKNYGLRAEEPDTAELATLGEAFNAMLEQTQNVQRQLATEIEATRRAEQQLRLVMDATPGLLSYIDTEQRYRIVNQQYENWFGVSRAAVVGRKMAEVLGEAALARLQPYFDRACAGETVKFEAEVPYREGGPRWIHAHYIPHRASDGLVLGVIVLVLDMTERRRMEASLAQAHAELERHSQTLEATVQERTTRLRDAVGELEAFSYSIAHDMRAPLRSMQGFSRLLVEEHGSALNDEAKSYLRRIVASANRLDRLIQDVLNYSRVVRGELCMEEVDTHTLVEDIIATYPNLQQPNADVRIETMLPRVCANPAALTQVVSNLLGNAVKFVDEGTLPQVRVFADSFSATNGSGKPEPWVRLHFCDNGIGIPRDAQQRLFAMFQRLHRPNQYEGTGMGLAIVRKAVERMGGRLGVESGEGQGSRFWVELKAKEPA